MLTATDRYTSKIFANWVESSRQKPSDEDPDTLDSMNNLIDLYEAWGKPEKAEEWRAKLLETEATEE